MRLDDSKPSRLADYKTPDYLIDTVNLDIRLDRHHTRVRSLLGVDANPKGKRGAPLVLDGDGLTAVRITLDGVEIDLTSEMVAADRLIIETPPPRRFSLMVETMVDPSANTQLMGLYKSGSVYCTQCEAEGFRRITYFLDRPDVLSVYTTRIEADRNEAPVLLGNGNLVQSNDIPGSNRHVAVWHDPHPKPCYLFAVVGGDLGMVRSSFTTRSGREVELRVFVEHGKEQRAAYAMDSLKRAMAWDEQAFGREYDLDVFNIVAVSDFNMGAMENKSLNIFNDKYVLALPETATDADYANIESVIAHEYFHNWTGNRITCRDWFQLCLKEGLTVFRDQEFSASQRSATVKRIDDVRLLRATQFPEDAGPLAHNVRPDAYREVNNFYTATVYSKGAEIIRMLKTLIGDPAFAAGMTLYFERLDGVAATVEDFLWCFAMSSGRDLTQFKLWYEQAGTPVVRASAAYNSVAQTYTMELSQNTDATPGQEHKEPLVIPVALGLIGGDGREFSLTVNPSVTSDGATEEELARGIFELSTPCRRIIFSNIPQRPVPSLFRRFSAPVRVDVDLGEDDLLVLLRSDGDGFNRWQATQTYATLLLLRSIASLRLDMPAPDSQGFIAAIGEVIARSNQDPAFAAQVVLLPSETDLAQAVAHDVDPDAILAARDGLYAAIGRALAPQLLASYRTLERQEPYAPDATSAGRRSLRNGVLAIYAAGDPAEGAQLALEQFRRASNMTDPVAAAAVLSRIPGADREDMLAHFFAAFANDPLVIDKWFLLQASIAEPGTLERVQALMHHEAFSLTNPNRVRALIGSFATINPTQFNRPDGAGYDFLVDIVARLDEGNPQVAARLLSAFRSWHRMEHARASKAEAALRRLSTRQGLSSDVSDILTRALA